MSSITREEFDIVIIGGGSAGLAAAKGAGQPPRATSVPLIQPDAFAPVGRSMGKAGCEGLATSVPLIQPDAFAPVGRSTGKAGCEGLAASVPSVQPDAFAPVGRSTGKAETSGTAGSEGHLRILLLEKEEALGGILLQCAHNGFGLHRYQEELTGPEYALRAAGEIEGLGVEVRLGAMALKITPDLEVHYSGKQCGYRVAAAKAVICATGCDERTRGAIRIPGDRPSGVMTAGLAQHYMNLDGFTVGRRVFILGSGDIGLIMARRVTLEGGTVLGVAELMPYSNGLARNVVQCLDDFGIPLYLSHTVKRIVGKERLEKIVIAQVDEKFEFVPGTEKEFNADTLLLSVGLTPSVRLLAELGVKLHPKTGGPLVDEMFQTSMPGIFACGNGLHVHDLADSVSSEGEIAGAAAARFVRCRKESVAAENVIRTEPRNGIAYLLPSFLHLNGADEFQLKFRAAKPFRDVSLLLKLNGKLVKKTRKPYLLPAEMESLHVKGAELDGSDGVLSLEVSDE